MAENSISQVTPIINENVPNFLDYQGKILFSAEEIGRHLGYKNPSKSINILFSRNQKELNSYAVGIKLMSTDGKFYEVRHFTEEGVYILSMLGNTPKAGDFRTRVAALLRHLRQERIEAALLQGQTRGYQKGLSEADKEIRALETANKTAYLDGMKEGSRLQKRRDGLARLLRIREYIAKGLSHSEIGKILGISRQAVSDTLARAKRAGLLAGNMREVPHA